MTTAAEFHAAEGVEDWRVLYHVVAAHFRTRSFAEGVALVDEINRLPLDAPPRMDLRDAGVTVTLTARDIAAARLISAAAAQVGLLSEPAAVQLVNVTIDALVGAEVLPFWCAVLGYRQVGDDVAGDPRGRGPGIGLQPLDVARPQRNRVHLDVAVPHDQAEARVAAALTAGGRLVSDAHAPKWWILADAEGNEACVATWQGRG
ncbi:VOC family protein [Actinoplanes sp. M2I2]|uniref:VOC family protein n=1 Tax=Actinoplanes sp. M2I2 TaxID=1734444 RepID=UPI00201FB5CE|nr:VOC family protein [Actinoplanes sp. M2I2]